MPSTDDYANHILASLAKEDLDRLRPHLRRIELTAGEILYEPDDRLDRVYFPESGLISLITAMGDGQEIENCSRGRDGAIGYVEACGSQTMNSRARVQIGGEAWWLPACAFRDAHEQSPALRSQIQRRIEVLLADARQSSACRAAHSASNRLARTLLECHHHTGDLRLPLTQEYLSDLIGVGRTTVTHTASEFQAKQLIRYSRGVVILTNLEGLRQRACECYHALRTARDSLLRGAVQPGFSLFTVAACF